MNNSREPFIHRYKQQKPGLEIQASHHLSWKDIDALLITAFEGGSNYWLAKATPMRRAEEINGTMYESLDPISWESQFDTEELKGLGLHYVIPLVEGNYIELVEDEEAGNAEHVLLLADVKRGLEVMAKKYTWHWRSVVEDTHDSETADVFLQCCIFKEIVYG